MIKNLLEKPFLFIPYYLSAVKRNIEYLLKLRSKEDMTAP
jgi:flagellar assembly factor FliW